MARSSDGNGIFSGVRFVLSGFDSLSQVSYRLELTQKGGVDLGMFEPSCTHLIVSGLVYDDPICALARSEGKIVVNESWVDDSLNFGILADPTRVLYRPVKDLNGIPGCESLLICLTGYQKQERKDIIRMVSLMGAWYSKALIAKQVTHLICYKFEGQKYELAKKVNIKLVNHRWIEDCLKAWEIQPIHNHTKSGHELEIMEANTRNSEEKNNDDMAPNKNGSALNADESGTKYEFIITPKCKESRNGTKADSCETQLVMSNIFGTSSVSSNGTTISKLRKKSKSPVEPPSSHSVNFTPNRKRKACYESKSSKEMEGVNSFSNGEKDSADQKIVRRPNILESFYSKLLTFFKK